MTETQPHLGFRAQPLWLLVVAAIIWGQAGLANQLFGGKINRDDSRPVVEGRHPLHFYHGQLGAETFRIRRSTACFDPAFQAGYPKTPVFDGGCRTVELVLFLSGKNAGPAAYKYGLWLACLGVPLVYILAARGIGLTPAGGCVAGVLGCAVWWSPPVRAMLDAGQLDFLLAGHAAIVYVAWLSRYHWEPGVTAWCVLTACSAVGWFGHPVVWLGLAPIFGLYYLVFAPRHDLGWHLGLLAVVFFGLVPNFGWLWDWGRFWWLRQPSVDDIAPLPTWGTVLDTWAGNAKLLGPAPFGWPIVVAGLIGCLWMLKEKHRSAPALVALAGLLACAVARLGTVWLPTMNGEADRAASLVVGLAVLPAVAWFASSMQRAGLTYVAVAGLVAWLVSVGWGGETAAPLRHHFGLKTQTISLGLTDEQNALVEGLIEQTTPDARILFEETPTGQPGWNWTALLPWLTNRTYIGGLDPDAKFEHAFCRLRGDTLNGRRLSDWTDTELEEFARRYNVGWVVTRSTPACERWQRVPWAKELAQYRDGGDVRLFQLQRPHSFVLFGQAKWTHADRRKVVLTDIIPSDAPHPDGGIAPSRVIVLSLHHQEGLRVSPSVVIVERDPDPYDPIPMVRLRLLGPMSRIVLSWENP
jgi:hypothetical protein